MLFWNLESLLERSQSPSWNFILYNKGSQFRSFVLSHLERWYCRPALTFGCTCNSAHMVYGLTPFNLSTRTLLFLEGVSVVTIPSTSDIHWCQSESGRGSYEDAVPDPVWDIWHLGHLCRQGGCQSSSHLLPSLWWFWSFHVEYGETLPVSGGAEKLNKIHLKEEGSRYDRSFFHVLFWRNLYAAGPDKMFIVKNYTWTDKEDATEKFFSLKFSHIMPMAFWGIYQVIVIIFWCWTSSLQSWITDSTKSGRLLIGSGSSVRAFIRSTSPCIPFCHY